MELQCTSSLVYHFPVLLLLLLLVFRFLKIRGGSKPKRPPGPWKLPILGSMHHMAGSLPHRTLRDLARRYGPLMRLQLGEIPLVVVSSPKLAAEVMKTHDITFASRPKLLALKILAYDCTNICFAPYGEYWRELRKICTLELLNAKTVQSFGWIREEEASKLVGLIASKAGSPVNLTQHVKSLTYQIIAKAAFGKECSSQEIFIQKIEETMVLAGGFEIADIFPSWTFLHFISGTRPRLEKMRQETDSILENIISEHLEARGMKAARGDTSEDLIDILLKFKKSDDQGGFSLTTNNIKAVMLDVFGAGGDTASTTIDWAMAEMIKNPRTLEKAQAEVRRVFDRYGEVREDGLPALEYLKLIVKETLRLHPPGPLLLPRECRETCEINGFEISKKTRVLVNAWAIGRDPEYWKEPETFDPERFLLRSIDYQGSIEYMPFGAGRRMCPGQNFGLATVEHQLAVLLYHFDWKLPDGMNSEDLDMTEFSGGLSVTRKQELYLTPTPYRPFPSK